MLNSFRAALAGPDPDAFFQGKDEDLAASDHTVIIRLSGVYYCLAGYIHKRVVNGYFQPDIGDQVGHDLLTAIDLFRYPSTVPGDMIYGDP